KVAAAIRADGILDKMLKERYSSWDSGVGARIDSGKDSFASLEKYMLEKSDVTPNNTGRQELLEDIINTYLQSRADRSREVVLRSGCSATGSGVPRFVAACAAIDACPTRTRAARQRT